MRVSAPGGALHEPGAGEVLSIDPGDAERLIAALVARKERKAEREQRAQELLDRRGRARERRSTPAMGAEALPVHGDIALAARLAAFDRPQERWKLSQRDLENRLSRFGRDDLRPLLAQPLQTDVPCGLLAVHWHTLLAAWLLERSGRPRTIHLLSQLAACGAGPKLTAAAVDGFLASWDTLHTQAPDASGA